MAYQEGDTSPPHINVHNEVVTQVQELADERNVDVILPPQRNIGDTEHVKDHNLITDALAAVAAANSGKVLQVVRATDNQLRSVTNSSSFVDTGLSVTISPSSPDSEVLLMVFGNISVAGNTSRTDGKFQIANNSGQAVTGGEVARIGLTSGDYMMYSPLSLTAFDAPSTTAPVTYKLQFAVQQVGGTNSVELRSDSTTSQMYAIELADVVVSP
jgi:hypothetical protein